MLPSFFSHNSASAGSYELKWDGEKYTVTLTDENNVLSNFTFTSSAAGLDISASGNKLTISSDTAIKGSVSIKAEKINGQRSGVVVWTDGKIGSGQQDYTTYGVTVSDTVTGYLNLEVKTGGMKLIKTSEDGKVEGISFTISGEGFHETRTTNSAGEIDISDLNPGVYTVTEQAIDRYEPPQSQRVTIVSGQTASVHFNNTLKRGDLEVTKTSEDGLVEGATFHLYGTSLSGLEVDEYAVADSTGVARFEEVLIGTGYVLEEVDVAIRYVVPEAQSAAIEWNEVTHKSFQNILKKFRVTVTKSDSETGTAQGDASLAGATYGIYKGDTLIDSYTTDENSQFTTRYYVCDSDWSIREINPSEGYLLDPTVYPVGAEPELYEIELNDKASLRDLTFEESVGFPINRIEDIDTVRRLLAEQEPPKQEEPVKLRSVVIDLTAPAQEETPAKKEELPAPPPARREKVSPFVLHPEIPSSERHNFRITDDHLGEGGAKTKFKNNVAAIRTLNEIEFDDRLATPEEQEILSRYVGWGGLPQAFDENNDQWADEFAELYGLLSPEEYEAAKATTLNAHYTSPTVIKAIYQAVENMGFRTGNVLEKTLSTLIQWPVSFVSGLNWFQPNKAFESGFTFAQ